MPLKDEQCISSMYLIIFRECGFTIPADIVQEGRSLTIQFCSDNFGRRGGFHARYTLIDSKSSFFAQHKFDKKLFTLSEFEAESRIII